MVFKVTEGGASGESLDVDSLEEQDLQTLEEEDDKQDETDDEDEDETDDEDKDESEDEDKQDETEDEDEDEEEDSEGDDEDETEDEPEDDEEPEEVDSVISTALLKKDFPEIFQKHPALKHVIFNHKEYVGLFGSVDSAKDAADKATAFENMQDVLLEGNSAPLLGALHKQDPIALDKFIGSIIPALQENAPATLTTKILNPVIKTVLRDIIKNNNNDENYRKSAQNISKLLYGTYEIPDTPSEDPRIRDLEKQRERALDQKSQAFFEDLGNESKKIARKLILRELDPKGKMVPVLQRAAISDVMDKLQGAIGEDDQFKTLMSRLGKSARRNDFRKEDRSRLKNAYLARARRLIPGLVKEVKRDAIVAPPLKERKRVKKRPGKGGPVGRNREQQSGRVDYSKSDEEILSEP